jgi:predicted metal-dependent phosphoesterase TrpH
MKIKLDLHIHTIHSFDSTIEPEGLREVCLERGLAGVAVTDHDSLEGGMAFAAELPDLMIIAGEEIRSREGEIIGLFLEKEIPPGLSAPETMQRIHEQGGVVVIPHPFDYVKLKRMRSRRLQELLAEIDAIEAINGKPRYWGANKHAMRFAERWGIAKTGGSDAHSLGQVGLVYTEMEEFTDAPGFISALREAVLHGKRYSPWVSQGDRWRARMRKTKGSHL